MNICLNQIEAVKEFVALAETKDYPLTLESSIYRVNAKSLLGVFSLDLSKPVNLVVPLAEMEDARTTFEKFAVA